MSITYDEIQDLLEDEDDVMREIINVRCFTCGKVLTNIFQSFSKLRNEGRKQFKILRSQGLSSQDALAIIKEWTLTAEEAYNILSYEKGSMKSSDYQILLDAMETAGRTSTPEYEKNFEQLKRQLEIEHDYARIAAAIAYRGVDVKGRPKGLVGLTAEAIMNFFRVMRICCRVRLMTPTNINMDRNAANIDWDLVEGIKSNSIAAGDALSFTGLQQSLQHDVMQPYGTHSEGSSSLAIHGGYGGYGNEGLVGGGPSVKKKNIRRIGKAQPVTKGSEGEIIRYGEDERPSKEQQKYVEVGCGILIPIKRKRVYIAQ